MKHLSNARIAELLGETAALYEMENEPFKPRAYERAALAIEAREEPLYETFAKGGPGALKEIPGIGAGIAAHIAELLARGTFAEYERLKKKTPVSVGELVAVEGIGPKTVKTLWEKLKIKNLDELEAAARAGGLRALPGFGEKSEEKILKGIAFRREVGGRMILGAVLPVAHALEAKISAFPEVKKAVATGSVRRMKETVGNIDLLVISEKPEETMEKIAKLPEIERVDVRIVPAGSWSAVLNYFTGSKAHNIALRERALKKGWELNEYGLFKTEEELYEKLGLSYIEPELREMTGELEASENGTLPTLIGYDDLKGDLQAHSTWTDGTRSIEEMASAAQAFGLEYIAMTDHTQGLAMTGGMDEKEFTEQAKEIDALNARYTLPATRFKILKSAEVNIKKDGSLDLADDALAKMDFAGASVHSHFELSVKEQTKRLIKAIEHPLVDIIFHPSARILNKRPPIAADWSEVIAAAKENGTVLEIDAAPERLDLHDEMIRQCVQAGVLLSIGSDAHSPDGFKALRLGLAQARRGWAERKDIVNTLPVEKMLVRLKRNRGR
ncbi:MAG: polymerase X family protein [Parcubacteria group bacterium GW2011_GWA2_47_12]|nr:MAG: polymerase X family protein [Parcubacteria group bacterium GW2011_GWA2_47_12]